MVRKKKAVKDKFYNLAKQQGYRARSSFKLVQLNRKYDLLAKCSRAIDLCAAPGGWLQVLEKNMPKGPERQIVGVDILPITPVRGCVTFQADITTQECRTLIKKEMQGKKADLVLCDGAPNVGADYTKDAFVQNELTVHALKFACDYLRKGGNFVTKVFRSSDYNALMWAFQQLFEKVEATKPSSSRNVSAEIFVACLKFKAPHKIDPRLLDPKHVLSQVEDETAQIGAKDLFHKKSNQKKNRAGYDSNVGIGMFKSCSANEFINGEEPIKILASASEIHFKDEESKVFLKHPKTTNDIKECVEDLKVLGKGDLRTVLKWRKDMRAYLQEEKDKELKSAAVEEESESGEEESEDDEQREERNLGVIDEEIDRVRSSKEQKERREKKRKRREMVKHQRRIDMGMENPFAIDLSEEMGPFSLKGLGLKNMKELDDIKGVHMGSDEESESEDLSDSDDASSVDSQTQRQRDLLELEEEMNHFHSERKKKEHVLNPLTVRQRRQQLVAENKAKKKKKTLEKHAAEDIMETIREEQHADAVKKKAYQKLIAAEDSSDDEQDDDDEEESSSESEVEDEDLGNGKIRSKSNPLVVDFKAKKDAGADKKNAERWFKQGLFEGAESESDDEVEEEDSDESEESEEEDHFVPLPSAKTDKAKRKEKRRKLQLRNEKKEAKRKAVAAREAKGMSDVLNGVDENGGFETVKSEVKDTLPDLEEESEDDETMTPEQRRRAKVARALIRKGMGDMSGVKESAGFEVVAPEQSTPAPDSDDSADEEEKYDSEDYDTDERAHHLALGSLMVKKSKRRKLLDAGYHRYAHNDDELPEWFIADENKHYRPQVPVTKEMVAAIKARYKDLAAKPINKVAEARARKKRKLMLKVEKAKRQATAVVDQPDLTPGAKMRAIQKIYKGAKVERPGSVYVVSRNSSQGKKNLGNKLKGKKVKLVDKRSRADEGRGKVAKQKRKEAKKGGGGRKRKR